jgi:anaerobic ribonucleoside-triphosphate reductase activating protein
MQPYKSNTTTLNIAATCPGTRTLGPGLRAVVWVQGCSFNCKSCISPDWKVFSRVNLFSPQELSTELLLNPEVSGLTISGGEPMLQAEGLAKTVRIMRTQRDIDVICFTGYRYEQLLSLKSKPGIQRLLQEVDVLIDGEYRELENTDIGLRGSMNQNIIHLTDRLKDFDFENCERKMEVRVQDGALLFVGIPGTAMQQSVDIAYQKVIEQQNELINRAKALSGLSSIPQPID